jgi:hypothetical protein
MHQRLRQFAFIIVAAWVAFSPYIWWRALSSRTGLHLPLEFIAHPVALALIAIIATPFLLMGSRKASVAVISLSVVVFGSLFFSGSPFRDGVVMNAVFLIALAVLTLRSTRPARQAAQSG